jgi:hypothetical protein
MSTKAHPLFTMYPLNGEQEISVGRVPTPYQTYDGHGLFIGGTADLTAITELLQNEKVYPIQTVNGRAIMGIWVVDFSEASLGSHQELQFSILVAHKPTPPLEDHPLTLLKALFTNPDARMFAYGLWNNTETAVAYNRELLGLNARLTQGKIKRKNGQKTFHFSDATGQFLFAGHVSEVKRASPRVGLSLMRLLGFRQTVRALRQPYLEARVVNPIGDAFPYNGDAQSYLASDSPIVQFFDPANDRITFSTTESQKFGFEPHFIEHFEPFRFVYLQPEKVSLG